MNPIKKKIIYLLIMAQVLFISPAYVYAVSYDEIETFPEAKSGNLIKPSNPEGNTLEGETNTDEESLLADESIDYYELGPTTPYPNSKGLKYYQVDEKIEFNPTDKRDLENIILINSVLPELRAEFEILSELSGRPVSDIESLSYTELRDLAAKTATENFDLDYVLGRLSLIDNVDKLSEIAGISLSQARNIIANKESNQSEWDKIKYIVKDALEIPIDLRVIETLNYLVRPKDDPRGGAGHWHIKVSRLRKNYTREKSRFSRESDKAYQEENNRGIQGDLEEQRIDDYSAANPEDENAIGELLDDVGANEEDTIAAGQIVNESGETVSDFIIADDNFETNTSAHYYGQAIDISEIDDIKCTLIKKRRLASDKKEPRPPIPIKLQWQTKEGYGEDSESVDSSYNDMFLNMSQSTILDMLSELNIDFANLDNMEGASFSDIAGIIGQAMFSEALGTSSFDFWKFDIENTLRKLGGVILADKLNLPREPFLDTGINSIEGLFEALGRYNIERNLGLPYGSLKGSNRNQMLATIGRERLAKELGLPQNSLNFDLNNGNQNDFYERIGSSIIETELGFAPGSFYNRRNLAELKDSAGSYKIDALLSSPESVDSRLSIDFGTTARLKSGGISPKEYTRILGQTQIAKTVYAYHEYPSGSINVGFLRNTQRDNPESETDVRDEMLNLPEGTIDKLVSLSLADDDLKQIGIFSLANQLESNDTGRTRLTTWLNNPNRDFTITEGDDVIALGRETYASALGVDNNSIYTFLGSAEGSRGLFIRNGRTILTEAFLSSSDVEKYKEEFLRNNPNLAETIETYEFIKERIDSIAERVDRLEEKANNLKQAISSLPSDIVDQTTLDRLPSNLDRINNLLNMAGNLDEPLSIVQFARELNNLSDLIMGDIVVINEAINVDSAPSNLDYKINAFLYELEGIARIALEITTGQAQNDFRIGDVSLLDLSNVGSINFGGISITYADLALFLSGKVSPEQLLLTIGSAKLGDELGLPANALKYASIAIREISSGNFNLKDAFFRAIGLAILEDDTDLSDLLNIASTEAADLARNLTIEEIRDSLVNKTNLSRSAANKMLAEALGLGDFSLESLMSGNTGLWMRARDDAEANDARYRLPAGSTESFVKGEPLGKISASLLSDNEIRQISTGAQISESAIKTFISVRDGNQNPSINQIYFVDHNPYQDYQSEANVCVIKDVPDESYLYYDQDGEHVFNSYASANEYQKANQDKKLDYFGEISSSVNSALSSSGVWTGGDVTSSLRSFLENQGQAKAFADSDYENAISLLSLTYNTSESSLERLFSRDLTSSGESQIDFLKILGYHSIEHMATNYLNNYLNIQLGPAELTPDDIYEIFNGNSGQVFANIGASILGDELDVERGTIEDIILAGNSDQLKCALENAAAEMLGNMIGISGVELYGLSLGDNFGGGKIERFLGFPRRSFRGNSLDELLNQTNGVPVVDFLRAFSLPISKTADDMANSALREINEEYYQNYKNQSFYQKAAIISDYIQALGTSGSSDGINLAWGELQSEMYQLEYMVKNNPNLWENSRDVVGLQGISGFESYDTDQLLVMWKRFKTRREAIDSRLSLDSGTTLRLLTEEITPNEYRGLTKDNAIRDITFDVIKNALGLGDSDITRDSFNKFIQAIEIGYFPDIYSFLDQIFSINLDKKAGFENGTFLSIIENPDQALPILLRQGARELDQYLGLVDRNGNPARNASLTSYVDISTSDDNNNKNYCMAQAELGASFAECMEQRSISTGAILRNAAERAVTDRLIEAINSENIAGVTINIVEEGENGDNRVFNRNRISLSREQIAGIFDGDFRSLEVVFTIKAIKSIIGDDNNDVAVSTDLLFNYQDVVGLFYGDPDIENYARNVGYASERTRLEEEGYDFTNLGEGRTLAIDDNGNVQAVDAGNRHATSPPPNYDRGPNTSSPILTDYNGDGRLDVGDQAAALINERYGTNANSDLSDLGPEPDPANYGLPNADSPEYYDAANATARQQYQDDLNAWTRIRDAGEAAARDAQQFFRKSFEYKAADCALQKLDDRIPAGFYWAMTEGNGYTRTVTLISYIENILRDEDVLGFLPEFVSLTDIYNYFENPAGRPDLRTLLTENGTFGALDNLLNNYSINIFGTELSFKNGTAAALFSFIDEGTTDKLKELYSGDWLAEKLCDFSDKMLGLPSGTSLTLYTQYRNLSAYRSMNAFWSKDLKDIVNDKLFQDSKAALTKASGPDSNITDDAVQSHYSKEAKIKIKEIKAAMVAFLISLVFSKQIAQFESALGLVPGSGSILVGIITSLAYGLPVPWLQIGMFVLLNLFGVYKVVLVCSTSGGYPGEQIDPERWDVAGLNNFDGMNQKAREKVYIEVAQYKADRLIKDIYEMGANIPKEYLEQLGLTPEDMAPRQVMTGREEDVQANKYLAKYITCPAVKAGEELAQYDNGLESGVCAGSRAGLWQNPQTTAYTHIGF